MVWRQQAFLAFELPLASAIESVDRVAIGKRRVVEELKL